MKYLSRLASKKVEMIAYKMYLKYFFSIKVLYFSYLIWAFWPNWQKQKSSFFSQDYINKIFLLMQKSFYKLKLVSFNIHKK
ncbi:hypothetical protein BJI58_08540 [Acinetobacter baumannii]|nr:hypothetical protein BJI58_08540 [Acinetobacter baumannii]